jgi:hypothetical protein
MADGKTLNTMGIIINGVSVIDPSELSYTLSDISASDAGRDESLEMDAMILGQARQYTITWNNIDPENANKILKAVSTGRNAKGQFPCTFYDVLEGEMQERMYYVGNRTAPFQQWIPDRDEGKIFNKLSFTLIEATPDLESESE